MSNEGQAWEDVSIEREASNYISTDRLSVPGGWIYRTIFCLRDGPANVATTFVPFARFSGDELAGRFATSPHNPKREPPVEASAIPNFSAPAPKWRV